MKRQISIIINGISEKVPEESSIEELLDRFQEERHALIVEHNGRFVYPQRYGETRVQEGDVLEFIQPDFGG